jgi:hypothetical protein
MLLETVQHGPPKLVRAPPDLKAMAERANHAAGRRPG